MQGEELRKHMAAQRRNFDLASRRAARTQNLAQRVADALLRLGINLEEFVSSLKEEIRDRVDNYEYAPEEFNNPEQEEIVIRV